MTPESEFLMNFLLIRIPDIFISVSCTQVMENLWPLKIGMKMSLMMKATKSDVSTISGTDRKMANGMIIVVISIHNLFVKRFWNEVSEIFPGKNRMIFLYPLECIFTARQ